MTRERDPERIAAIIQNIKQYWENHPELRLGQIVGLAAMQISNQADPFYIEDEDLLGFFEAINKR